MTHAEPSDSHLHRDLPAFEAPPVVEVSVSLQFTEIEGLNTAHLGLVWQKFRREFPRVETQPPLPRILEPDRIEPPVPVTLELKKAPPLPRMWFISGDGTRLVQIQGDRFAFNWRRLDPSERYPRYDQIRSAFLRNLGAFAQFLKEEGFEDLDPDQVDLTYVNHISATDKEGGFSPLENHLLLWAGAPPGARLPRPDSVSLRTQLTYRDGDKFLGRLHIDLDSVFQTPDGSPAYQLQLTARGAPLDRQELQGVPAFLDRAHVWIVQTFASLTTKEMHNEWQRRQ